jgi:hypothetical protein
MERSYKLEIHSRRVDSNQLKILNNEEKGNREKDVGFNQ